MKRFATPAALAASFLLASAATVGAQQDEVTYYDRAEKKEVRTGGTIEEETTAGIRFKSKGAAKLIPTPDVRSVAYRSDRVPLVDFHSLAGRESRALAIGEKAESRRKTLAEVLKGYEEMAPKLKDAPAAQRYVQFKIAAVKFQLSRDDPAQLDAATAALGAFKTDHGKTWETVPCLMMLALALEDKGDPESAVRAYRELVALPGLPADLQREAAVLEGKLLLRAQKFADAEKKFQDLLTSSTARDPQEAALLVLRTQSRIGQGKLEGVEEQLRTALQAGDDAAVKAMAYNTLGDYYLKKGEPEDAFWNYLKVDLLYGQDREEQARALYHLARLFESVKSDSVRGQQCLERLRQLEGTEYQRKAAAGAKTEK
jgi:hypothetical protein